MKIFYLIFLQGKSVYKRNKRIGWQNISLYFQEKNGFLLTTAATDKMKKKSQDLESFFGKIWFFELATKNKILFLLVTGTLKD